jgi:hypothetical protein
MDDTGCVHRCDREDQFVINLDMARFMHRHGEDWVEMTPVADHSPDARDPERRLVRGERVFRCSGCDDEMRFVPRDGPG